MKNRFLIIFLILSVFVANAQNKDVFDVARKGTVQEMKDLVNLKPDTINAVNPMGFTPLILACYRGNVEVANYLIDNVKNLNYESREGTALASLSINYNKELIEKLLKKGVNPNTADSQGNTPLLWAIKRGNVELAKILMNNKANLDVKDASGISPFEYAVKSNNTELINLLKSK
jgi:ankyrin repeat protein